MINQQWSEGRCWSVTGQLLERPGPEQNGSECPSKQLLYPRCDAIVDRDILLTQIGLLCGMVTFNVEESHGVERGARNGIGTSDWLAQCGLPYSMIRISSTVARFPLLVLIWSLFSVRRWTKTRCISKLPRKKVKERAPGTTSPEPSLIVLKPASS